MKAQTLKGLKRASWLFALLVGIITIFADDSYPEYGIVGAIIAFIVARIALWVIKGFSAQDTK